MSAKHAAPTLSLWVTLLLMAGCHEERLPTAVEESSPSHEVAAPTGSADHRHESRHVLVAEAKEALGAVLTGEQTYFQIYGTYVNAADGTEIRTTLGVELGTLDPRWGFSVTSASTTGFLAIARGRSGTSAEDLVVTLTYERGHRLRWSIRRERD